MQDNPKSTPEEVSLSDLIRAALDFFKGAWKLLLGIPSLAAVLIFTVAHLNPKYESEGLLSTPGLGLVDWRNLELFLEREDRAEAYLAERFEKKFTPAQLDFLTHPELWKKYIEFKVPFSEKDKQVFPEAIAKGFNTLGLNIKGRADAPEEAQLRVELISDYIKQTAFWLSLRDWVFSRSLTIDRIDTETEQQVLAATLAIESNQARIKEMTALISSYPEARRLESSTVVSVQEGGGRYLSPVAQVIALETQIQDAREKIRNALRQKEQAQWLKQFYQDIRDLPNSYALGSSLSKEMRVRLEKAFPDPSVLTPSAKEALYSIRLHLVGTEQLFMSQYEFKSPPTLPLGVARDRKPTRLAFIGFLITAFLTIFGLIFFSYFRGLAREIT